MQITNIHLFHLLVNPILIPIMGVDSIKYVRGKLEILDQTLLPQQVVYIDIKNVHDGWDAIKLMKVRGKHFLFSKVWQVSQ